MLSAGALGQKPHDDGLTAGAPPAGFAALAAQAQGSEKRERGPSVDMGAVPPLNLDYWDLHPHMGFAGVVMLEDDTKMQLEVLFGMIDRDHSGELDVQEVRLALKQIEHSATIAAKAAGLVHQKAERSRRCAAVGEQAASAIRVAEEAPRAGAAGCFG